jgi:hypothetical protein
MGAPQSRFLTVFQPKTWFWAENFVENLEIPCGAVGLGDEGLT